MKKLHHVGWLAFSCGTFAVGWWVHALLPSPKAGAGSALPRAIARHSPNQPAIASPAELDTSSWWRRTSQDAAEILAAARPGEVNAVLLRKMTANFYNGNAHEREPQWQALVSLMRIEDAPAIRDLIEDFKKTQGRECLIEAKPFWYQWGRLAGEAAINELPVTDRNGATLAAEALYGWAIADDKAALEWASNSSSKFPGRHAALTAVRARRPAD
jgi:hypothetical protein